MTCFKEMRIFCILTHFHTSNFICVLSNFKYKQSLVDLNKKKDRTFKNIHAFVF